MKILSKILLLAALSLLFAGSARASYTIVNSCISPNVSGGPDATCTLTVQPNRLIVVSAFEYDGGVSPIVMTDSFSMTWLNPSGGAGNCAGYRGGDFQDFLYINFALTGSNSGSDTFSTQDLHGAQISVVQVNVNGNLGGADGFEQAQCGGGTTGSAGTVTSPAVTTGSADDFIFIAGESTSTGVSAYTGWNLSINPPNGTNVVSPPIIFPVYDSLTGAPGSYTGSFNQTGSGGFWLMVVAAFKTNPSGILHHKVSIY